MMALAAALLLSAFNTKHLSNQFTANLDSSNQQLFFAAMMKLNGSQLGGAGLEISLAKPPSDKKKKEDMLRKREHRMMQAMAER